MDEEFEEHRPHLKAVATRILGSPAEADDALQEAWIRAHRTDTSDVDNMGGWLTTVVSRVCLTTLAARTRRREEALEAGKLPDPVITLVDEAAPDPADEALTADAVGAALLVALEKPPPAARPPPPGSWPRGRGGASRAPIRTRRPPPARSSRRSSRPRAAATSRGCSPWWVAASNRQ